MSGAVTVLHQLRGGSDFVEIDQSQLKSPVVFCIGDVSRELRGLLPDSLQVWRLNAVETDSLELEIADDTVRSLRESPHFVAAVVASDENAVALAEQGAAWLRAHGSRIVPEPIVASPGNMAGLVAGLAGKLVNLTVAQAEFITTLSRELANFRTTNETLQNQFHAVEGVLVRKGLQPYELDFVSEPMDSRSNVLRDATKHRIAQVLPVGSTGISAVGVHLAEAVERSKGYVKVQVTALEDGVLLETWSVPTAALRSGWNVFGFGKTIGGLPRTLELSISASGASADLPCLSLGAPQPLERFRVQDDETRQAMIDASLALQVWTGLAGVALPQWATYWSAQPLPGKGMDVPLRQEIIAPDVLSFAAHYNSDEVSFSFDAVQALIAERVVTCHPPADGMTVARLPGACPAGALRVSAFAIVDNAQSKDVEFAVVTAADGARARALLNGESGLMAGESFSDWIRVSPAAKKAVNAFISQPIARWQDIFIATRMAQVGNNDFAWAKFQDLTSVSQDLG